MQGTMIFGIWDELGNKWMLCEFDETKHSKAVAMADFLNKKNNNKRKEEFKRYVVKAK
jgi:hypothetical protein